MRLIFEPNDRVIVCNPKLKTFDKAGTVIRIGQVNFLAGEYTFGVKLDNDVQTRYYNESSLKLAEQATSPLTAPEVQVAETPDLPRVLSYDEVKGNYYVTHIKDGCDVSNHDLSNRDLTCETFRNVNFNGCIMSDVCSTTFYNCSFVGATFDSAESTGFNDCNMEGAIFTDNDYEDAEFEGCNLRGATFAGCFRDAVFGCCDMTGAIATEKLTLWGIELECPKEEIPVIKIHKHLDSYNIVFMGNHIQIGCKGFTRKDWENFTDGEIRLFDGRAAVSWWHETKQEVFKLHDEYLAQFNSKEPETTQELVPSERVKYNGAIENCGDYSNMDLSGCFMYNGSFYKCKFNNSILPSISHSSFGGCEMVGAVFADNAFNADFDGCNLQNAVFNHKDFEDAKFRVCDMRNVTFAGNFRDATFSSCNLEGAKLAETPDKFGLDDFETNFRGASVYTPVESVPVLTERVYVGRGVNDYSVSFFRDHIQIGCKGFTRKEWENFTDVEITDMDFGALAWWNTHKTSVFKMHDEYLAKLYL